MVPGQVSRVTTLAAPIGAPSPMVMPGRMVAPAPLRKRPYREGWGFSYRLLDEEIDPDGGRPPNIAGRRMLKHDATDVDVRIDCVAEIDPVTLGRTGGVAGLELRADEHARHRHERSLAVAGHKWIGVKGQIIIGVDLPPAVALTAHSGEDARDATVDLNAVVLVVLRHDV